MRPIDLYSAEGIYYRADATQPYLVQSLSPSPLLSRSHQPLPHIERLPRVRADCRWGVGGLGGCDLSASLTVEDEITLDEGTLAHLVSCTSRV